MRTSELMARTGAAMTLRLARAPASSDIGSWKGLPIARKRYASPIGVPLPLLGGIGEVPKA